MRQTSTPVSHLGASAFIFGFPLLLTTATMRRAIDPGAPPGERMAPNRFAHLPRFPDPAFRPIVGANADSLYSLAWLDLEAEPVLLHCPDTGGRSYLMPILDAWSNVFASLGPRTTAPERQTYALVGPEWSGELPEGVRRIDAPTNVAWTIFHLHTHGRADLDASRRIQAKLALASLHAHHDPEPPSQAIVDPRAGPKLSAHRDVMSLGVAEFLANLAAEMGRNPPASDDAPLIEQLAEIGLRPGAPFDWASLPREVRDALAAGLEEGRKAVAAPPSPRIENGWQFLEDGLGTSGVDYLRRAQVANVALGMARPEDAVFPLTAKDSDGRHLNGACRYVLRFDPGSLPPVGAIWSLALYDMDQLFVENPLDRYAIGSRDELMFGSDGSLEVAIQQDPPTGSPANWLPAPDGDFNLMLHLYWPSQRVLDGSWKIPPVQRVS
jgi:hypothetical protein